MPFTVSVCEALSVSVFASFINNPATVVLPLITGLKLPVLLIKTFCVETGAAVPLPQFVAVLHTFDVMPNHTADAVKLPSSAPTSGVEPSLVLPS